VQDPPAATENRHEVDSINPLRAETGGRMRSAGRLLVLVDP
jgi:hypothetical protein